jgi:hypothetical protein
MDSLHPCPDSHPAGRGKREAKRHDAFLCNLTLLNGEDSETFHLLKQAQTWRGVNESYERFDGLLEKWLDGKPKNVKFLVICPPGRTECM